MQKTIFMLFLALPLGASSMQEAPSTKKTVLLPINLPTAHGYLKITGENILNSPFRALDTLYVLRVNNSLADTIISTTPPHGAGSPILSLKYEHDSTIFSELQKEYGETNLAALTPDEADTLRRQVTTLTAIARTTIHEWATILQENIKQLND